jgi:hypothetical protein
VKKTGAIKCLLPCNSKLNFQLCLLVAEVYQFWKQRKWFFLQTRAPEPTTFGCVVMRSDALFQGIKAGYNPKYIYMS